jgi:hypothetical protein
LLAVSAAEGVVMRALMRGSFAVVFAVTVACSSDRDAQPPEAGDSEVSPVTSVSGPFVSSDPSAQYAALDFEGTRYTAWKSGCSTDACAERGTFRLDVAAQTIAFHDDATDTTQTFGIKGRSALLRPQVEPIVTLCLIVGGIYLFGKMNQAAYDRGYSDGKAGRPSDYGCQK